MKKYILLALCLISMSLMNIYAQEKVPADQLYSYKSKTDTLKGWKFSGVAGINFGQTSLTNWAAGGDNTISGNVIFNASANYRSKAWFWDNNLSAEYGLINSSSNGLRKSADRLSFMSIGGRDFSKNWSVSFLLNFNTQFAKGYNYPDKENYISTFMAPAYLDGALGITYKPTKDYTFFISPLTERLTFVLNDSLSNAGAFGVDPGDRILWKTGAYLMATTKQTLWNNLSIISTLDMFTPYNEDFGNIEINWDLLLSYKFNKLFTATLNTTLRYYDKEIQKVQFKEILGLGLTYNF